MIKSRAFFVVLIAPTIMSILVTMLDGSAFHGMVIFLLYIIARPIIITDINETIDKAINEKYHKS